MNIWMTTQLYPTPDDPRLVGDADALRDFARCWVADGHSVTVLHAYMEKPVGIRKLSLLLPRMRSARASLDGVEIVRVEMRLIKSWLWLRRVFMRAAGVRMRRMLLDSPAPDLIVSHFPALTLGLADALGQSCPRACVMHTTDVSMLARKGARAMPSGYGAVGFRSARIRDDFRRLMGDRMPGFMVLSGAPDLAFGSVERMGGDLKVLFAGKLIERKQPAMLIRALARLPSGAAWRLTIAGDGPERASLNRLVAELGLSERVQMTGRLGRDEVFRQMAAHNVFAMISYGETFGIAYMEAMAAGMIPVGTAGEGIDGVIRDEENGFLIGRNDEGALTARFQALIDLGEDGRRALAERAQTTARGMTAPEMARVYLRNAQDALNTGRPGKQNP